MGGRFWGMEKNKKDWLTQNVLKWIVENKQVATDEFSPSAKEVIDMIREINERLD
jgi:hypothetical protein